MKRKISTKKIEGTDREGAPGLVPKLISAELEWEQGVGMLGVEDGQDRGQDDLGYSFQG